MIAITARPARGFWRANVFHPAERVFHKESDFTPAQLDELMDEPELIVEEDVYDPADYVNYLQRLKSNDPLPDRRSATDRRAMAAKAPGGAQTGAAGNGSTGGNQQ